MQQGARAGSLGPSPHGARTCTAEGQGETRYFCGAQRRKIRSFCGAQRREIKDFCGAQRRENWDFHFFCKLLPNGITFPVDPPCPGCHPCTQARVHVADVFGTVGSWWQNFPKTMLFGGAG